LYPSLITHVSWLTLVDADTVVPAAEIYRLAAR
jgi:hypothetical protein